MKRALSVVLCLILILGAFSVCAATQTNENLFLSHVDLKQGVKMVISTGKVGSDGLFNENGALNAVFDGDKKTHTDVRTQLDWGTPAYVGVFITLDNEYYCDSTRIYSGFSNMTDTYRIYASDDLNNLYTEESMIADNVVCGDFAEIEIQKNIRYISYFCTACVGNQRIKELELWGREAEAEDGDEEGYDSMKLYTSGTEIMRNGKVLSLRGVNIPQFSWSSYGDGNTAEGKSNAHIALDLALNNWNCSIIRLAVDPNIYVNGGIGTGNGQTVYRSAEQYRSLIDCFISEITSKGIAVVLDCHAYAGVYQTVVDFWNIAAPYYDKNDMVMYGLLNEPISDWTVYYEGGEVEVPGIGKKQSIGMTALLDIVRKYSDNIAVIAGIDWAFDLSGLSSDKFAKLAADRAASLGITAEQYTESYSVFTPERKGNGIVLDTHIYSNKPISWDKAIGAAVREYPVLVGEYNPYYRSGIINDLTDREKAFYDKIFKWIKEYNLASTAWSLGAEPFLTDHSGNVTALGKAVSDFIAHGKWSSGLNQNLIFEKYLNCRGIAQYKSDGRIKYENSVFSRAYDSNENIGTELINNVLDGETASHYDIWPLDDRELGMEFELDGIYAARKIAITSGLNGYEDHYKIYASSDLKTLYSTENLIENGTQACNGYTQFKIDKQIKYIAIISVGYARIKEVAAEGTKIGDINRDLILDSKDLVLLRKMMLDTAQFDLISSGDINCDKNTDILDLIKFKKQFLNGDI